MISKRFKSVFPMAIRYGKFGAANESLKGNIFSKSMASNSYHFSELKKIKQAFYDFLNYEVGTVVRNTPKQKERKYKHIQISKQFKQIEEKRKKERLIHLQKRKILIQAKLDTQTKLLSQSQKSEYGKQLKTLESILQENEKQLAEVQKILSESEAQYVLLESWRKIVVINKIEYLRHMNRHPSGVFLAPNQVQNIENVYYLVTNNLPVNRYKIYQLTPQLFTQEIDELDEVQRKLVRQKYLKTGRNLESNIQYFLMKQQNREKQGQIDVSTLKKQMRDVALNVFDHAHGLLLPHSQFLERVRVKDTIWRNYIHIFTCLLNSQRLNLKNLTKEELALKETLHQIQKIKQDWALYIKRTYNLIQEIKKMPTEPPEYIANHPVLMQRWNQINQRFANPIKIQQILNFPQLPPNPLQIELRKYVSENFDIRFAQIINSSDTQEGRKKYHQNLPQNKRLNVEFYQQATNIMQNIKQLQSQQQYFKQLPKRAQKSQRENNQKEQKYIRIQLDQYTKMIHLNNKNKDKYSLQFFSKYFGIQEDLLRSALDKVSYMRVNVAQQVLKQGVNGDINPNKITQQIIKFIF